MCQCTCHIVRGRALGICRGRATHFTVVALYVGEGSEREQCCLLSSRPAFKRLQFLPLPHPLQIFTARGCVALAGTGTLVCAVCLTPKLFLPVHLHAMQDHPDHQPLPCYMSSLHQLLISDHTSLDECFLFNSLVVGLPHNSVFWQFWLFSVFKLVVSFFWLCEKAKLIYLHPHLGWNPLNLIAFLKTSPPVKPNYFTKIF